MDATDSLRYVLPILPLCHFDSLVHQFADSDAFEVHAVVLRHHGHLRVVLLKHQRGGRNPECCLSTGHCTVQKNRSHCRTVPIEKVSCHRLSLPAEQRVPLLSLVRTIECRQVPLP